MNKPILVIMAAGMGSRYGGLKQIDPVDEQGHIIIDFSLYDAMRAGFERAIFIIKKENEQAFKEVIGDRVSKHMEVKFVFQDLNDVPEGFEIPEGRVKPWGTAHAIYSCRDVIDAPFAVINDRERCCIFGRRRRDIYRYFSRHTRFDEHVGLLSEHHQRTRTGSR